MLRSLFAVTLLMLLGSMAQADIGPPKGFKRLPLEHKITTEKDYPEFSFFAVSGDKATPVKLDAKTPATIVAGGGRYRSATLVAVPKDAAKKFGSEKEFLEAVVAGKVDGQVKSKQTFLAFTEVKDSDPRKLGVMSYTLEKIDLKDGIVLVGAKVEGKPEEEQSLNAPASRSVALGLALSALIGFTGLVITRFSLRDRQVRTG